MRILIIAVGSTGDVQPMICLGKELAARGHSITIAAFSAFQPPIENAGLCFFPLPGDAKTYIGDIMRPGASPARYLSRLVNAFHHSLLPLLDAMHQACVFADAVISTFFGDIPQSIANHFGVPFAEFCFCPMYPTKDHCLPILNTPSLGKYLNLASYHAAYFLIRRIENKYARAWFDGKGMVLHAFREKGRPILNAYSSCLSPRPAEWPSNLRVTGFLREAGQPFTPSPELLSFLRAGPPIYIGFGSMTAGDLQKVTPIVQSVLQKLNMRAVLSSGWSGLSDLNLKNIYLLKEYVPHEWLFQQVFAVAHHGGAGTTCAGLREGKPTLVIPFGGDQPFWGACVHRMGLGPKPLPFRKITEKRLMRRFAALQLPEYQKNAAEVSQSLKKENGTRAAADILEAHWKAFYRLPE